MKLNWISKIIFFFNILVGIALAIANFSSKFEPVSNPYGYLFSMAYPLFLVVNIFFVLYWAYLRKMHFLFSLILIIFGYSNVTKLVAWHSKPKITEPPAFSIMTFNVRLLNQYLWLDEENIDDKIFQYIEEENPDIVAFQEFVDGKPLGYKKRLKELGYRFSFRESNTKNARNFDFFGLTTFSKHKITNSGFAFKRETTTKAISIFTDIKIEGRTIRVYNTHLNSLGFISEDYEFVENITKNSESEAIKKSKNILNKVIVAARLRQVEVDGIVNHMSESPYPIIVLGDFNEPPYSFAYPRFTNTLEDPFQKFGFGLGTTFDGISTLPGLRLDYVLHGSELQAKYYKTGPKNLSDHRSVVVDFSFSE